MNILRIIKEEINDFEWAEDINVLDSLTDKEMRNAYTMLDALMGKGLTEPEAIKVLAQYKQPRRRFKHVYDEDTAYWVPNSPSSTFQFKYPPKWDSLTRRFVDWVRWNPGGTKKQFYTEVLNKEYYSGHQAQFFGSIVDSGILKTEKGENGGLKYFIGPNFEKWTEGKLKRYMGMSTPWRFNGGD